MWQVWGGDTGGEAGDEASIAKSHVPPLGNVAQWPIHIQMMANEKLVVKFIITYGRGEKQDDKRLTNQRVQGV